MKIMTWGEFKTKYLNSLTTCIFSSELSGINDLKWDDIILTTEVINNHYKVEKITLEDNFTPLAYMYLGRQVTENFEIALKENKEFI